MTRDRPDARVYLQQLLRPAGEPPAGQLDELAALFRPRTLDKGEHLQRAGDRPTTISLLATGLLRLYYLREDGREFTKGFVCPVDLFAPLDALADGLTRMSVQAIAPTALLVADHAAFTAFCERDIYWQRLARVFLERFAMKKIRREASLLMDPAPVRYEAFLADYAALEPLIPDHLIASYLGITPESLSRLKRQRLGRDGAVR